MITRSESIYKIINTHVYTTSTQIVIFYNNRHTIGQAEFYFVDGGDWWRGGGRGWLIKVLGCLE